MTHSHGNEYQIRIVRRDGTEELSGWMHSTEQVAQTLHLTHGLQGTTCWLLVRNIICANCSETERVLEYPIVNMLSARYIPHDSRYLQAAESRNPCVHGFLSLRQTP